GQMLMPEKNASGSSGARNCATSATAKMISGPPQTDQKTVLTNARFRRSIAVPPPGDVRLAMHTLIHAAMPSTASAMMMSCQITLNASQSRNHAFVSPSLSRFDSTFESPLGQRYQGGLNS